MKPLLAIVVLTWKAAFRYRLFWVMAVLLVASVTFLPAVVEHDGTARGFAQIVLTYTLGSVSVLLGVATLWLACGTLARDVEEGQAQMLAVKPAPRWKIWLGKWLGLMTLNATLLALAGGCIYGLLQWRAQRLPPEQLRVLREEVLVARASLKEPPTDIAGEVESAYRKLLQEHALAPADRALARRQIEETIKARQQVVAPGYMRQWKIAAGPARNLPPDAPLFIRAKFFTADNKPGQTVAGIWRFGPATAPRIPEKLMSLAPETFHEFPIPAAAISEDGILIVNFLNKNPVAVLFPLDEGLEVLYRESGFGLNLARALGIIFCWLGLLSAIGLAAASFLSFPVAAFCAMSLMVVTLFSGHLAASVQEGTIMGRNHETGQADNPVVDAVMLPVFQGLIKVINLATAVSPIEMLGAGRSITWGMLSKAAAQIILLLGGIFAGFGMYVFTRRELAAAQGTS